MRYIGKIHDIQRNKLAIRAFAEDSERATMFVLQIDVSMVRNLETGDLVRFDLDENGECTWINKVEL